MNLIVYLYLYVIYTYTNFEAETIIQQPPKHQETLGVLSHLCSVYLNALLFSLIILGLSHHHTELDLHLIYFMLVIFMLNKMMVTRVCYFFIHLGVFLTMNKYNFTNCIIVNI